ncbi:MAG TPA: hypothetical protein VFE24_08270 [Pirellulales bacterium]|jgi:hypothetical protein|nr:hypothetical protein [Pirellulales bacterium]
MTDRERWIVYPLLFLSLGIGVRGKFVPSNFLRATTVQTEEVAGLEHGVCHRVASDTVECNQLIVRGNLALTSPDGRHVRIQMGSTVPPAALGQKDAPSGILEVYGEEGVPLVVLSGRGEGVVQLNAFAPADSIFLTPGGSIKAPGLNPNAPEGAPPEEPPTRENNAKDNAENKAKDKSEDKSNDKSNDKSEGKTGDTGNANDRGGPSPAGASSATPSAPGPRKPSPSAPSSTTPLPRSSRP